MNVLSLFAGIGGIDLAFERAGARTAAAVELDPAARGVIADRMPGTALMIDVTEVTGDDLRAAGFDPGDGVLAAGWPCQGNSVAGRRGGMDDARSGLWMHVARLLAELRPRWFVGENVPGLLSVNGGRDFGTVLGDLAGIGYGICWRILDAQHFGVAQRRRRVFIVGCLGNRAAPVQVLLEPESIGGDPAPRPEAGARVAGTLMAGSDGSGWRIGADEAAAEQLVPFVRPGSNGNGAITVPMAFNPQTGGDVRLGYGETPTALQAGQVTAVLNPSNRAASRYDVEYGDAPQARPGEVLRALREAIGSQETSIWCTGVAASLQPPQVLRPLVHGGSVRCASSEDRPHVVDGSLALTQGDTSGAVCLVWEAGCERRTPSQWRLDGQLAEQLGAYLSELPHQGAPTARYVRDLWEAAEGAGLLREALPALQEDGRPGEGADAETEDLHGLWPAGALAITLQQALHASETSGHPASDLIGGVGVSTAVRRLTPLQLECERLQGFPDDWTATSNGRPQSDSARYRQLGNAVAVPCVEWIAWRIVAADREQVSTP